MSTMTLNSVIARGSSNDPTEVKEVQSLLNKAGYSLTRDGIYGMHTEAAVIEFQKKHGLKPDGIIGPITWSKLNPDIARVENNRRSSAHSGYRNLVCLIAEKYEGLKETKPNGGSHIDRWLKECGLGTGYAWCMAFVQGCFAEAAIMSHFEDPLKPNYAGVLRMWDACKAKGWTVGKLNGKRGDIIIFDHGKGTGHTGIVLSYSNGYYETIEGNTGLDGGRDGDGVAKKRRSAYNDPKLLGFIRVPDPGAQVPS